MSPTMTRVNKWHLLWLVVPAVCLSILYKRAPVWFAHVDMPEKIVNEIDFSLIEGSTKVVIRQLPMAFNPAFIKYRGRYLLITRQDAGGKWFIAKKWRIFDSRRSAFHLLELDNEFQPIPSSLQKISLPPEVYFPHDPRFFVIKDELYIIFNMPTEDPPTSYWLPESSPVCRRLHIGKLSSNKGKYEISDIRLLTYPESMREVEKNWTPFVHNDELYVTYTLSPYTVLHVDRESGACTEVLKNQDALDWRFGDPRGGTPGIEIEGGFLSIFHSNLPTEPTKFNPGACPIYLMGAYFFEKEPPFRMKKISPRPFAFPSFYAENNQRKIIFPTGMVLEGDQLYVALGKADKTIEICQIPVKKLISSMVDYE